MNRSNVSLAIVVVAIASLVPLAAGAKGAVGGKWKPAVQPKDLTKQVNKGVRWLLKQQLDSGAWGQGEESSNMGRNAGMARRGNVGDTSFAALALIRSGSTPVAGPHRKAVRRGASFVMGAIEESDKKDMWVTKQRGTRLQGKLGPYIDTFASVLMLSEIKGQMGDKASEDRVGRALHKVLSKIQRNQRDDGTWDDRGWAPALAQGVVAKGLNRAKQIGADVEDDVLERTEKHAAAQYDGDTGAFGAGGSAGVSLYAAAASTGAMADSVRTNEQEEARVRREASGGKTKAVRDKAARKLQRFAEAKKARDESTIGLVGRLNDPAFIAGFGSNGGEEFLSYMMISETLVTAGGKKWNEWDRKITKNLNRIQNNDGSWTGHHCITGRTFCTAAALLVLTADRAPMPVASKIRGA
jgi:hypothetical protein